MKLAIILIVVLAFTGSWARQARFDNYQVFRLTPRSDEQVAHLKALQRSGMEFDFWKSPEAIYMPVDVMVPPHKIPQLQEFVYGTHIDTKLIIDNVQNLIDESAVPTHRKTSAPFNWQQFHRLETIYSWLKDLAVKHPEVTLLNIGKSYEGRDIKGVKVSFKAGNKAVFLEGGIHAREWIAPATVTYILNELLTSYDPAVRDIAQSYDWYMFPVTNPDGYEYTHTTNRVWRKTRQTFTTFCTGADPNRNWGFHWMDGGSSNNPCDETYAGSSAFSEPETKALAQFIASIHKNLVGYIAFHSYSQYLLIPYGHTNAHLDNYNELMSIGKKAAYSLAKRYGTRYTVGNIVDVIYVASGGSMDWVKGTFNTPITYTYELRDTGRHGFLLPPNQIIPTAEETLDSLVTIMQEAKARGY